MDAGNGQPTLVTSDPSQSCGQARDPRPPRPAPPRIAEIPYELQIRSQWVLWAHTLRKDGKWAKVPYQPANPKRQAKADVPSTWGTFDAAWDAYQKGAFDGIGYEFATDDPYFGVDVDKCLRDGELLDWASPIVERLGPTYGEISQSGTGIKFIARGALPERTGKKRTGMGNGTGALELYDHGRYFALTGDVFGDPMPIVELQAVGDALYAIAKERSKKASTPSDGMTSVSAWMMKASNGAAADVDDRIRAYLDTCEPAISGQGGHDVTFRVTCKVVRGFDRTDAQAFQLLMDHYNPRCQPPWDDAAIRHKIESSRNALDPPIGSLLNAPMNGDGGHTGNLAPAASQNGELKVNESPDDPHRLARGFVKKFRVDGLKTIRYYRGEWLYWEGAYRPVKESELSSKVNQAVKSEFDRLNKAAVKFWEASGGTDKTGKKIDRPVARKVTCKLVADIMQAIRGITLLRGRTDAPCWLEGQEPFKAKEVIPTKNALVHLPSVVVGEMAASKGATANPTPRFFSTYALDFDFILDAEYPSEWVKFLNSVWEHDQPSIDTLQEWFGYCLTPDTHHEKILALIGPKRAGKDTIGRVLTGLVGAENTAGPTLAGLGTPFGLAPLIGKPLAIVSDARISGRTDSAIIVERLLAISGRGALTIDRKFIDAWTGNLPTRFVLISNELPRLTDSSGALASRLVILRLTKSFYGVEDMGLFDRLKAELPGILLWAIQGWRRLRDRGYFVQPKSGGELMESLEELSSPVLAFVRQRCDIGAGKEIRTAELFREWSQWCQENGTKETGTQQSFARDLRAACPGVETDKTTRKGEQLSSGFAHFLGIARVYVDA
jgi:putative DNA primase/helicase